jgi:hypothetical protein
MSSKSGHGTGASGSSVNTFGDALKRSEPRPDDYADRDKKKNYAQRLSNSLAILIANKLREIKPFGSILPGVDGTGSESGSSSGATKKTKHTDVRYATMKDGLELLVSIKTLNFRDKKKNSQTGQVTLGRFTKNMVRNDHELRAEAMDHHERFPYAVMIALFFLPTSACEDGAADRSSFAHAVVTFRARAGRTEPTDPPARFERFFIGLYDLTGRLGFFDVTAAPPRRGQPPWPDEVEEPTRGGRLKSLEEVTAEIAREYGVRNRTYVQWADEPHGGVIPDVTPELDDDADEDVDPDSQ